MSRTLPLFYRKFQVEDMRWSARSLADEPIGRLMLDGKVVRVRLDREATSISLLIVMGVRADGHKVLLTVKSMGGESTEAGRTVLDDLIQRPAAAGIPDRRRRRRGSRKCERGGFATLVSDRLRARAALSFCRVPVE